MVARLVSATTSPRLSTPSICTAAAVLSDKFSTATSVTNPPCVDTDRSAKFSIVPTGTSFSAGGHISSTDEKWQRSLSAEQKLFGSVNLTGKVSETPTGELDRSLTAGFKRNW
jgi:hypothetical protein